jgi:hypothetical protein
MPFIGSTIVTAAVGVYRRLWSLGNPSVFASLVAVVSETNYLHGANPGIHLLNHGSPAPGSIFSILGCSVLPSRVSPKNTTPAATAALGLW